MYKGLSFDELNVLYEDKGVTRSEPLDEFYSVMDISNHQRRQRIETAKELEDLFTLALMLMFYMEQEGSYDYAEVEKMLTEGMNDALTDTGVSDFFKTVHVAAFVSSFINTTMKNPDEMFNFSYDRAKLIAENESNSIWEDSEYEDAVNAGKTKKKWHSILDNRTRDTHWEMAGVVVPINEPFQVGAYLMMFPRDDSLGAGPEEIANCRCHASYY